MIETVDIIDYDIPNMKGDDGTRSREIVVFVDMVYLEAQSADLRPYLKQLRQYGQTTDEIFENFVPQISTRSEKKFCKKCMAWTREKYLQSSPPMTDSDEKLLDEIRTKELLLSKDFFDWHAREKSAEMQKRIENNYHFKVLDKYSEVQKYRRFAEKLLPYLRKREMMRDTKYEQPASLTDDKEWKFKRNEAYELHIAACENCTTYAEVSNSLFKFTQKWWDTKIFALRKAIGYKDKGAYSRNYF